MGTSWTIHCPRCFYAGQCSCLGQSLVQDVPKFFKNCLMMNTAYNKVCYTEFILHSEIILGSIFRNVTIIRKNATELQITFGHETEFQITKHMRKCNRITK